MVDLPYLTALNGQEYPSFLTFWHHQLCTDCVSGIIETVRRPRACGTRVLSLRYFLVFSRLLLISDDDLQCDVSIVT